MEQTGTKRFSYGAIVAFAVLLFALIAGAMFFADELDDFFDHSAPRISQAMELRGSWLGMRLASMNSETARRLGVPVSLPGVMVVEIDEKNGWRVRQAGVTVGDVIVGVDGKTVRDLGDLYDVSVKLDVANAVLLDVQRWGQPMSLVLPALYTPPLAAGAPQPGQGGILPPMSVPAANTAPAQAAQPVAWVPGGPGPGQQFYCRVHNQVWPQSAVQPNYRCPIGNCPLNIAR